MNFQDTVIPLLIALVVVAITYPSFMIRRLYRQDEHCTASVAFGLALYSRIDPRILKRVLKVLADPSASDVVKCHAATAIGFMGRRAFPARNLLIELVHARGRWSCPPAICALESIGATDSKTKDALKEALLDRNDVIAESASLALDKIDPSSILDAYGDAVKIEARRRVRRKRTE